MNEAARLLLSDPALSLPRNAKIIEQEGGEVVLYDPERITRSLQPTMIDYVSNPPMTEDGFVRWLTVLGYRQGGKSLSAALCFYPKAAYNPGWKHVTIADKTDRADELFRRVMFAHQHWPSLTRSESRTTNEVRQLTFLSGSKMGVLSGQSEAAGIGLSVDSLHGSELPFWPHAGRQYSQILPAIQNRKHSYMILESTPATLDYPSAIWWKDRCDAARLGLGRDLYAFFPFWDGLLNVRKWYDGDKMELDEVRLMEKYGRRDNCDVCKAGYCQKHGLTLANLAFRRFTMAQDQEISKNPSLFGVYFPFDDQSCWVSLSKSVIPQSALDRHQDPDAVDYGETYHEWAPPDPDGVYVIGADPAGHGRDHGAFHVLRVWDDEWEQVAWYGGNCDPLWFAEKLDEVGRRYNNAIIGCESNGVGLAAIVLLRHMKYPRILYGKAGKPGIHKSNDQELVSDLVDALVHKLTLHDRRTVDQMKSYQNDRMIERSVRAETLAVGRGDGGRRPLGHWDRVSAMMMACVTAPRQVRRYKPAPVPEKPPNVVPFKDFTWDELQSYDQKVASRTNKASRGKRRATYTRHRKK